MFRNSSKLCQQHKTVATSWVNFKTTDVVFSKLKTSSGQTQERVIKSLCTVASFCSDAQTQRDLYSKKEHL